MKNLTLIGSSLFVMMTLLFSGCNEGENSAQNSAVATETATTPTGNVIDSNVSGLSYACRKDTGEIDTNGTTGSGGEFSYNIGDTCTFTIGHVVVGSVKMDKNQAIITPMTLMGINDINDISVTNLAILLQSLDQDGNASNGIDLNHVDPSIGATEHLDLVTADENSTFEYAKKYFTGAKKLTAEEAKNHFKSTLSKLGIAQGPSGDTSESVLTCDSSKFPVGTTVVTPTNEDWLLYTGTYAVDEMHPLPLNDNNMIRLYDFMLVEKRISVSTTGQLFYSSTTPTATTSACVKTDSDGIKWLVFHTEKGYLEFSYVHPNYIIGTDKGTVRGVSPINGTNILGERYLLPS